MLKQYFEEEEWDRK